MVVMRLLALMLQTHPLVALRPIQVTTTIPVPYQIPFLAMAAVTRLPIVRFVNGMAAIVVCRRAMTQLTPECGSATMTKIQKRLRLSKTKDAMNQRPSRLNLPIK